MNFCEDLPYRWPYVHMVLHKRYPLGVYSFQEPVKMALPSPLHDKIVPLSHAHHFSASFQSFSAPFPAVFWQMISFTI